MAKPGHRLYPYLSKVTVKSGALDNSTTNHDNWKVMVCEATGKKWSAFTMKKVRQWSIHENT